MKFWVAMIGSAAWTAEARTEHVLPLRVLDYVMSGIALVAAIWFLIRDWTA